MNFVVLDLETFFSDDYTLKKMSTEAYIRDPRFEAHGAAVKWSKSVPARWYDEPHLRQVLSEHDWSDTFLICHHYQFDGFILNHHYGIRPRHACCTMSMPRLLLGSHIRVGLDALRKHLGMPAKVTPYNLFRGKHWHELTPEVQQQVADGACDEVESIWTLFQRFGKDFPREEFQVLDTCLRMFTEPVLGADIDLLAKVWKSEEIRKRKFLTELGFDVSTAEGLELAKGHLQSADKFKALLEAEGVEIEYKQGKKVMIPCFDKKDYFMQDLLEHDNERVQRLAEARLGVKSTGLQTRAETLGWMARRGPMSVYLNYCGAGTLRVSGGDKANWLNFKRGSDIRRAVMAPEGFLLAPIDSSQIECIAEDQKVLTNNGTKSIQDVTLNDLVWDGNAWVKHEGVVCKGTKSVITYQGLTATPNHVVYVRGNCGEEKMEMRVAVALARNLVTSNAQTSIREATLRKPLMRWIQNVWSAWDKIQVRVSSRSSDLGSRKFATLKLYWRRNRSQRQQWALRTRQFAIIDAPAECQQLFGYRMDTNKAWSIVHAKFQALVSQVWIRRRHNKNPSQKRINGRTNYQAFSNCVSKANVEKTEKVGFQAPTRTETKTAKVYDIINAGPEHRFTVQGVLVSNCRVLHYLAGGPEDEVLQQFRDGKDPYSILASQIYGEQIYKPKPDDPRRTEMEQKRGCGKQARLMCGYGAAAPKYKATAKAGLYGPSVDVSLDEAGRHVSIYRDDTPSVCAKNTGYWAQCGRMLARLAGGDAVQWGPLLVKDQRIWLPNGTAMVYDTLEFHTPDSDELEDCKKFERKGWWRVRDKTGWKKMWGSKLTQNICEAVSRVIVSQAMNRITGMGYRVLNWPYDELLVLIPKDGKEQWHVERCEAEMKREVAWLPGLPLDCESHLGERYSK